MESSNAYICVDTCMYKYLRSAMLGELHDKGVDRYQARYIYDRQIRTVIPLQPIVVSHSTPQSDMPLAKAYLYLNARSFYSWRMSLE